MAYQAPAFYYYHAGREGEAAGGSHTGTAVDNANFFTVFDSRQGELLVFTNSLGSADQLVNAPVDGSTLSDAIDTIIVSGHNFQGAKVVSFGQPSVKLLITPDFTVTQANKELLIIPLTPSELPIDPTDTGIQFRVKTDGTGPIDAIVPEVSEVFFTTRHAMVKGPKINWQHPWVRSQRRFINAAGVSSTWLTGAARKTYRMTWENVTDADLTILLNLQIQTADWSHPFFFTPPDTAFPTLLMELDRESDWEQVFAAPLTAGIGHEITLPLIEVLG